MGISESHHLYIEITTSKRKKRVFSFRLHLNYGGINEIQMWLKLLVEVNGVQMSPSITEDVPSSQKQSCRQQHTCFPVG